MYLYKIVVKYTS